MSVARFFKHRQNDKCNKAKERQIRYSDVNMAARCGEMEFSLYWEEGYKIVEGVANSKYMGQTLDQTDDDCPEVR